MQSQNAIVMRGTPDELLLAQQAHRRPRQGPRRGGGRHRGARSEQELGEDAGHAWPSSFGVALQPTCAATNSCSTHQQQHQHGTSTTTEPDSLQPRPPQLHRLRRDRGVGHAQSAAHRQQHQGPAEPAHPRHRRAEGDHEDRLARSPSPPALTRPARPRRWSARWSTRSSSTRTWA